MKSLISDKNSPENYTWYRKVSASRTKPSINLKIKKNPLQKPPNFLNHREKIKEKLSIFRAKCEELSKIPFNERGTNRIDVMAMHVLKKHGIIPKKSETMTGSIPGIEIGDTFNYRVELMIVGLHSRTRHGIDFVTKGGKVVATCIVAAEGYADKMNGVDDILTYIGEGGMYGVKEGEGLIKDQKMERGNLALKNSVDFGPFGNDVRVVKGFRFGSARFGEMCPKFTYVYDGLYRVLECKPKRDFNGMLVFEFKLRRKPAQALVPWHRFMNSLSR